MNMIERVARAIWSKHLCDYCVTSADTRLPHDCCCYDAARAAIEVKPTGEMINAMAAVIRDREGKAAVITAQLAWDAAIAVALTVEQSSGRLILRGGQAS